MNSKFIILGAGKNKTCNYNPSLASFGVSSSFINWQVDTSKILNCTKVEYIGGYQVESLANILPDEVRVIYNSIWSKTGALYSLLLLNLEDIDELYITYNDVILDDNFIKKSFVDNKPQKITSLIDLSFPQRYGGGDYNCEIVKDLTGNEGEFVGFIYIPKELLIHLKRLQSNKSRYVKEYLSDWIGMLARENVDINYIDARGNWSDINVAEQKARLILKGKAQSLANLKKVAKHSCYLEQVAFSTISWLQDPVKVFDVVNEKIKTDLVVVRSSASLEDGFSNSAAGVFASQLGVDLNNFSAFTAAVNHTIESYNNTHNHNDMVLVQPYIANAKMHGVVFTKTHNGGLYYVFNYVYGSNTQDITSGASKSHETFYFYKHAANPKIPQMLRHVYVAAKEIEKILDYDALDIEFVIDESGRCIILQVRPQVSHKNTCVNNTETFASAMRTIKEKVAWYQKKDESMFGSIKSVWAVMPDWNPAEIIGRKPSPLALSLYEELVTDYIWARQRSMFGYYDLGHYQLMKSFYGIPYIDVKASFLSFVPATIDKVTALQIVSNALDYLVSNPQLHDKVEFEVVPTCYRFDFVDHYGHIIKGFPRSKVEYIVDEYKRLTSQGIGFRSGRESYQPLAIDHKPTAEGIWRLIENCKNGVLAFAHEARKAFIASTLLKSLCAIGVLEQQELDDFYRSIHTISQQISYDAFLCKTGSMSVDDVTKKYGHLRPGTYDITAPRYDASPEIFLLPIIDHARAINLSDYTWDKNTRNGIDLYLKKINSRLTFDLFINFIKDSITARELVKFEFTKDLSNILELIARYGSSFDLSRQDMSLVDLKFFKLFLDGRYYGEEKNILNHVISENKLKEGIKSALELPNMFRNIYELDCFYHPRATANFISLKKVMGNAIFLERNYAVNLQGNIVLIENADPGYDWIFSKNIMGLITMYGGVNSHMAIRAAEFGIPAAIGVGEEKFQELVDKKTIILDCGNKRVFFVN